MKEHSWPQQKGRTMNGGGEMKIVTLCGDKDKGCCPEVRIADEYVEIGEKGNLCRLNPTEWETLKEKILSREV